MEDEKTGTTNTAPQPQPTEESPTPEEVAIPTGQGEGEQVQPSPEPADSGNVEAAPERPAVGDEPEPADVVGSAGQAKPAEQPEPAKPDPALAKVEAEVTKLKARLHKQLVQAHQVPAELVELLPKDPDDLEAYLTGGKFEALKTKLGQPKPPEPKGPEPEKRDEPVNNAGVKVRSLAEVGKLFAI